MVDFTISANSVFYTGKNYLLLKLSSPTVLTVELSNVKQSFFMVSSYRLVLYRTFDPLYRTFAIVDFAISANLVFYIEKNSLLWNLSPPTVLIVVHSNFNQSFYMVCSYRLLTFRTINIPVLLSLWWTWQFMQHSVFNIVTNLQPIPHDHIPSAIGKTGLMACIIYTTKPAVSRKVGHAGACVFGD